MGEPALKRVGVGDHGGHGHGGGVRHPSVIPFDDARWACPDVYELVTQSFDRDILGIGSSPYQGDVGYLGVRVPNPPTVDQSHRYLIRLLGIQVANNRVMAVRGFRQLVTIGGVPPSRTPDCLGVPLELAVTSPFWHFVDGNISWHLRWENDFQTRLRVFDANQQPGTSPSMDGLDPVLLYTPTTPPFPASPYVPPGAGIPPGVSVDALGTWHDIRNPWDHPDWELDIPLRGPGTLVMYASVHQTNPDTRCPIFIPTRGFDALSPEDQFVATLENDDIDVSYQRVAGALTVELFPCCR